MWKNDVEGFKKKKIEFEAEISNLCRLETVRDILIIDTFLSNWGVNWTNQLFCETLKKWQKFMMKKCILPENKRTSIFLWIIKIIL